MHSQPLVRKSNGLLLFFLRTQRQSSNEERESKNCSSYGGLDRLKYFSLLQDKYSEG